MIFKIVAMATIYPRVWMVVIVEIFPSRFGTFPPTTVASFFISFFFLDEKQCVRCLVIMEGHLDC